MDLTSLASYGLSGVSIALIIALVIIVKEVLKLVRNHMSHSIRANTRLADKIEQLIDMISLRN